MALLNDSKTLSYYLAEDGSGFEDFKQWMFDCKIIDPISFKLIISCIKLEQTKWLEHTKRQIIFEEIKEILISYVKTICNKEPIEYFLEYITELDKYCFQGGYGHQVLYITGSYEKQCPHHWMIKPENYENIQKINEQYKPEIIKLCVMICNLYLVIDNVPTNAQWSN